MFLILLLLFCIFEVLSIVFISRYWKTSIVLLLLAAISNITPLRYSAKMFQNQNTAFDYFFMVRPALFLRLKQIYLLEVPP